MTVGYARLANLNAAKLFCLNRYSNLLIVRSKKYWTLPGGKINEGESILECLSREIREELPNIIYKVQSYRIYERDNYANLVAISRTWQIDLSIANEIVELKWIRPREIGLYTDYWIDFVNTL